MKIHRVLALLLLMASSAFAQAYAERMVEATFKVFNEKSTATGFVLKTEDGRQFLVSAAHVFEKMSGEKAILVSRTERDEVFNRKDIEIRVRKGERPLWFRHAKQDVAVLELDLPDDSGVLALPDSVLATDGAMRSKEFTVGTDVLVFGFPTRFEVNGAGFPVCRRGAVASFPILPMSKNSTMIIDFTTFEGDSGGPVFIRNGDQPMVVGLVASQFWHTENLKTFNTKQTINHSLGLATIAQASVIRQTLDMAIKKGEKRGRERRREER